MSLAKPNSLCGLPLELVQDVAQNLDTDSLKSLRLTCRHLAWIGYRSIEARVPTTIGNREELEGEEFVHSLILDLQDRMPKAASKVTALEIEYAYRPWTHLPPSLAAVKLPSLKTIDLTGVAATKASLQKMFRPHKATLKEVNLTDVALELPDTSDTSTAQQFDCWITLLEYIRDNLDLDSIFLNYLTWCNSRFEMLDEGYVELTKAKYHTKWMDPEQLEWFSLSLGGLEAEGVCAVKDGINDFLKEAKHIPQSYAARTWSNTGRKMITS